MAHREFHRTESIGWLRAAVLGANDGLISTSSLVVGVAAANPAPGAVLVAAFAGLVAGALSMAAGEYVSVSSQSDTESADLARERQELATAPESEHAELQRIYISRGLSPELAAQVADELTAHDALGAHARDELGLSEATRARPIQAALASAAAFAVGAALPLCARRVLAADLSQPCCRAQLPGAAGGARRNGRPVGRRPSGGRRSQGRFLGRRGHGLHGAGRTPVRHGGLAVTDVSHL